jgi:hypothetical protein
MLPVDHSRDTAEAGCQDAINGSPVTRVNNIGPYASEQTCESMGQMPIRSWLFLQLDHLNVAAFQTLQHSPRRSQTTQHMGIRLPVEAIDQVDDSVFEPPDVKRVKHVDNPDSTGEGRCHERVVQNNEERKVTS